MDVARFFKQTAVWEARLATDHHRGTTYDTATTIAVRWFTGERVVRTAQGREVVSGSRVSTLAAVREGDRITDEDGRQREVVAVRKNRNTRGQFSHYVADLA